MAESPCKVQTLLTVGNEVVILWEDGHESFYPGRELRLACTCAECAGEQHLFGRATLPARRELTEAAFSPVAARLVGNYGVQVTWGDGHDHGIYHLSDLRSGRWRAALPPAPDSQGDRP